MSDEQIKEEDECHQRMTQAFLKQKGYTKVVVEATASDFESSSESSDSEDDIDARSGWARRVVTFPESAPAPQPATKSISDIDAKRIEGKVKEGTEEPAPSPQPSNSVKGLENLIALAQGKPEPHVTFPEEPPLPPVEVVPLVVARPRALVADARGVKRWVRIKQSGRAKNA